MENGLLDDELDDIIEKSSSKVKSDEELKSHTIDEDLNDFKKSIILLKSNYEAQLICGIKMIPDLLRIDKSSCVLKVFPDFKESCFIEDLNRSQEFYSSLNECLIEILTNQLISSKEFTFHFVDLITNKIYTYCDKPADYENSIIFQLWIELMVAVIENLSDNLVKTNIFDTIPRLKLQFVSRRTREYISLILAKCAPKMNNQIVQAQLYPILQDLCNDTQYEVRAIACQSLAPVCRVLGPDITMNLVVPEMSKYLCDESVLVKTSCFQSLIEILELFEDQDDAKIYLLRKIQSFIDYGLTLKDEHYLITISRNIGTIINCLKDVMNSQSKSSFINVFYSICKDENLYTRRSSNESNFIWCKCKINLANSFPNVLQITNSINFENKLSHCLTSLVKDRNEMVREAIVLKFIEIAQKLGSSQYFLIITDFCTSLTDDSPQVLTSAIKQLEKFFNLFIKKNDTNGILNESQQMPGHQLVTKRLIKLEETISQSFKYSLHVDILQSFSLLPWVICTEFLVEEILPILEKRSNSRALPVKLAAIKSMLIILRKIPRFHIRNLYFTKLIEFSFHSNCYKRSVFIEICKLVIQLYSKNFFKSNFYHSVIKMAHDPVVNVKISFIKVLPDLKKLWGLRHDKDKLEHLEVIARGLLNDRDKDVSELAFKAITQMDFMRMNHPDPDEQFNKIKEQEETLLIDLEPKKPLNKTNTNLQTTNSKKIDQPQMNHKEPNSKKIQTHIKVTQATTLSSLAKQQQTLTQPQFDQFATRTYPSYQLVEQHQLTAYPSMKKEKKALSIGSEERVSVSVSHKPMMNYERRRSIETFSQSNATSINATKLLSSKKK